MTRKLVKWASNDGQIIKSGLSDGRRAKFIPSVVEVVYDWLRIGGHLGNVFSYGECRFINLQALCVVIGLLSTTAALQVVSGNAVALATRFGTARFFRHGLQRRRRCHGSSRCRRLFDCAQRTAQRSRSSARRAGTELDLYTGRPLFALSVRQGHGR